MESFFTNIYPIQDPRAPQGIRSVCGVTLVLERTSIKTIELKKTLEATGNSILKRKQGINLFLFKKNREGCEPDNRQTYQMLNQVNKSIIYYLS